MFSVLFPLFLLSIRATFAANCPNRTALHTVDVWVHHNANDPGRHHKSININEMDAYITIDIVKANVTVLCDGMIKMFPKLQQLSMVDVNLSEIHRDAFQNVPRLTHLSLSVNKLRKLSRDTFHTLTGLKVLFLSSNQIEEIDRDTFEDLQQLQKVHLDRNRLYEIDNDWFVRLPHLNVIDLSWNKISKLQNGVFKLPQKSRSLSIRLLANEIEEIQDEAFVVTDLDKREQRFLSVDLTRNHLGNIRQTVALKLSELPGEIKLNSNRIKCVGSWELEFLRDKTTFRLDIVNNPIECNCLEKLNQIISEWDLRNVNVSSNNDCDSPFVFFRNY